MDVVAEGIEVLEQVSPLIALQCEYGQGYLFSKPVDSEAARALLMAQLQQ
jgi:EAL domain-containing protein (putative c-di-GMP-specific phosphodiesterase class I)